MSKRPIVIFAALAAGALAGCGSSSSSTSFTTPVATTAPDLSAFKASFQVDKPAFKLLGEELATALKTAPTKTNGEIATEFKALARNADEAETAVRQLKPPAAYASQVNTLASGIATVSGDLRAIASAASTGSAAKIKTDVTKLFSDSSAVHAGEVALTKALGLPLT